MRPTSIRTIPIVLATLALAARGGAQDWCVRTPAEIDYIGRRVRIPAAGRCMPWIGYTAAPGIPANAASGALCTASDGSHVSLTITTAFPQAPGSSRVLFESFRFPLPTLTNGFGSEAALDYGSVALTDLALTPCRPPAVP